MLLPKKINIIDGEWLDKSTLFLGKLDLAGIQRFRETNLPFSRVYDKLFWGKMQGHHDTFFAKIDFRHWYHDDEDFHQYVHQITRIRFPCVIIAESPYTHEYPRQVNINAFEKKLFNRTRFLIDSIKNKHPQTNILSPAICVVSSEHRNRYLDYFLQFRSDFDYYTMHCINVPERDMVSLSAFFSEISAILPKELWITRWAVPSCDNGSSHGIGSEVLSSMLAAKKIQNMFETIEILTKNRSKWFFSGCTKDDTSGKMKESLWSKNSQVFVEDVSAWNNFLGIVSQDHKMKDPIVDILLKLAHA